MSNHLINGVASIRGALVHALGNLVQSQTRFPPTEGSLSQVNQALPTAPASQKAQGLWQLGLQQERGRCFSH